MPQQLLFSYQHVTDVFFFHVREDESLLAALEYHGAAIATILHAMDRFLTRGVPPEFFYCATMALLYLACQSQERCRSIYIQGGVREITRMMDKYRSVKYIQIIGIAALMVIGKVMLGETILLQILEAVEWNQECPRVYVVACSAFGSLFGPGSKVFLGGGELENHAYHQALFAITYGRILHVDDPVAQRVGYALLGTMVGIDIAQEMISEVERNHCGPARLPLPDKDGHRESVFPLWTMMIQLKILKSNIPHGMSRVSIPPFLPSKQSFQQE